MVSKVDTQATLEALWSNTNPSGLRKFYRNIRCGEELFDFMQNRPPAEIKIKKYNEVDDPYVVFVVPTTNTESHYAKRFHESFPCETIIFVESGGQFFNYARSCNLGLSVASKMHPVWIVLCNDDLEVNFDIEALKHDLRRNEKHDFLLPSNPTRMVVVRFNIISNSLLILANLLTRRYNELLSRIYIMAKFRKTAKSIGTLAFYKRFQKVLIFLSRHISNEFLICGFFIPMKPRIFERFTFNTTYINGGEDIDFMLKLYDSEFSIGKLEFEARQAGGGTIKTTMSLESRALRDLANKMFLGEVLFSHLSNSSSECTDVDKMREM